MLEATVVEEQMVENSEHVMFTLPLSISSLPLFEQTYLLCQDSGPRATRNYKLPPQRLEGGH